MTLSELSAWIAAYLAQAQKGPPATEREWWHHFALLWFVIGHIKEKGGNGANDFV